MAFESLLLGVTHAAFRDTKREREIVFDTLNNCHKKKRKKKSEKEHQEEEDDDDDIEDDDALFIFSLSLFSSTITKRVKQTKRVPAL